MNDKPSLTCEDRSVDPSLLYALERGINDMENGRELPIEEAMKKVEAIRKARRQIRA